jgi:hypothetical protein
MGLHELFFFDTIGNKSKFKNEYSRLDSKTNI